MLWVALKPSRTFAVCCTIYILSHCRHHSTVLNQLHWLPVWQRAICQTAVLTCNSLFISQPEHLSVLLSDYTPSRQLQSSDRQLLSQPADNLCSPAMLSAQPLLTSGTVYQSPFEQCHLPTLSNATWRLISPTATPPQTTCYHLHLRSEPVLT